MSKPTQTGNEPGLQRQLSPMHVWAIAFGCVIGWGSFVMPGTTFLPDSGPLGTTIGIVISALIVSFIFGKGNYRELQNTNKLYLRSPKRWQ